MTDLILAALLVLNLWSTLRVLARVRRLESTARRIRNRQFATPMVGILAGRGNGKTTALGHIEKMGGQGRNPAAHPPPPKDRAPTQPFPPITYTHFDHSHGMPLPRPRHVRTMP